MAPSFEEGAGLAVLQHSGRAHHDHRVALFAVYSGVFLEIVDVSVFKWIGLSGQIGTYSL